mgnify:FL=1
MAATGKAWFISLSWFQSMYSQDQITTISSGTSQCAFSANVRWRPRAAPTCLYRAQIPLEIFRRNFGMKVGFLFAPAL